VSDYCLTSNKQFVSCIMVRTYEFHSVDDDVCIVLDQHAKLYFFSAILLFCLWVDMLLHLDKLSWFWNQPVFALTS